MTLPCAAALTLYACFCLWFSPCSKKLLCMKKGIHRRTLKPWEVSYAAMCHLTHFVCLFLAMVLSLQQEAALREAAEREKKTKMKQKKAGKGKTDKERLAAEKAAKEAEEKGRAVKEEQERVVREEEERVKRLEQLEAIRKQVRKGQGQGRGLYERAVLGPQALWYQVLNEVELAHKFSILLRVGLLLCWQVVHRGQEARQRGETCMFI